MIRAAKLDQRVPASSDLDELNLRVGALVGQPFLDFRLSYGEELTAHFGQPRPSTLRHKLARPSGSFVLRTRGSGWSVHSLATGQLFHEHARKPATKAQAARERQTFAELQQARLPAPGSRVVDAAVSLQQEGADRLERIVLSLLFKDGTALRVLPRARAGSKPELADWELFLPLDCYLSVGPGPVWSCLSTTE